MKEDKLNIVFLAPGPVYKPTSSAYKNRFSLLSERMSGYILTTSNVRTDVKLGDFRFSAVQRRTGKLPSNLALLWHCVSFALTARREKKVDCIVAYDPLKTGLIGTVMKMLTGWPLVVEVNGVYTSEAVWQDEPQGLITSLKKKMVPAVMAYVFRRADGIKLQFSDQIEPFHHIIKGKVVRNFPNLTPISRFANLGESKEILLVGFPFKLKGVDLLIAAFKKIAPQFPDWTLKILGWYPDLKELKAAIAGHPQIVHHPPVDYKDMPSHIGRAGVIAQPSRTDALPRVLVEAAAAGKARIGSRVDGIPEVIEDGVDGLLVESENVEGLADALYRLLADSELRHKLGEAAARKAETNFSPAEYLENTYSFYSQVVCSHDIHQSSRT